MTEKVRTQLQAFKMRFLQKNQSSYITDKERISCDSKISVAALLLQIERSQLRWFGHVSRMPQEKLLTKLYLPKQMRKKTVGRPKTTADESILF